MKLIAIQKDGTPEGILDDLPDLAREVAEATAVMYETAGYTPPWIGYLAVEDGQCVGTCAFKSPPEAGCVEIAYFTFPGKEGRGVATRMASALIAIAESAAPELTVNAQTLPEENASTAILRKLGFDLAGSVEHPEDGTVWEWRRPGRMIIRRVAPNDSSLIPGLCDLLIDVVHAGSSVGFLSPLSPETASGFWRQVLDSLGSGLALWVAEAEGTVAGTVQLQLCPKQNGRHRAEILKLLVHTNYRGRGIASRLLAEAEAFARGDGRTLLVLDTEAGSAAEGVYRHLGWQRAGEIPDYASSPQGDLRAAAWYYKFIAP